jgi:hypothetical protein
MRRRTLLAAAAAATHSASARPESGWLPSVAGSGAVDLLLVLAVDVSSSIDDDEALLQREGYRAALTDPEVLARVLGGAHGAIGVAYVEWSDLEYQSLLLPWTRIASARDGAAWSAALGRRPLRSRRGTSVSGGIEFSRRVLADAPWPAARRVIDISGDGVNNSGRPAEEARDRAVAEGITINGIAIEGGDPAETGVSPLGRLEDYYHASVVGGADALVVAAEDFRSFGESVRLKLVREVAGRLPPCKAPAGGGELPCRAGLSSFSGDPRSGG